MADEQAWRDLGLVRGASPEAVKAAWRELALEAHPDTGGDPDRFLRLKAAYDACLDEALTLAVQDRPCPACKGTGKREIQGNFRRLEMACSTCGGSGCCR